VSERRSSGWDNGQRQTCKACGVPDKFNFQVPDEIWNAVVPRKLRNCVVCLGCFDERGRQMKAAYHWRIEPSSLVYIIM
jgi:hypothetical protein